MLKDLSWLDDAIFWRKMEHNQRVHPFGADGSHYDHEHLPQTVTRPVDDLYKSLAGELRRVGGFAKDATPSREPLWADFLRPQVTDSKIRKRFAKALMQVAELSSAQHSQYGISFVRNREPGFALFRVKQLDQHGFPKRQNILCCDHHVDRCLK